MLKLTRGETGFSLAYDGRTIFSHTLTEPML